MKALKQGLQEQQWNAIIVDKINRIELLIGLGLDKIKFLRNCWIPDNFNALIANITADNIRDISIDDLKALKQGLQEQQWNAIIVDKINRIELLIGLGLDKIKFLRNCWIPDNFNALIANITADNIRDTSSDILVELSLNQHNWFDQIIDSKIDNNLVPQMLNQKKLIILNSGNIEFARTLPDYSNSNQWFTILKEQLTFQQLIISPVGRIHALRTGLDDARWVDVLNQHLDVNELNKLAADQINEIKRQIPNPWDTMLQQITTDSLIKLPEEQLTAIRGETNLWIKFIIEKLTGKSNIFILNIAQVNSIKDGLNNDQWFSILNNITSLNILSSIANNEHYNEQLSEVILGNLSIKQQKTLFKKIANFINSKTDQQLRETDVVFKDKVKILLPKNYLNVSKQSALGYPNPSYVGGTKRSKVKKNKTRRL